MARYLPTAAFLGAMALAAFPAAAAEGDEPPPSAAPASQAPAPASAPAPAPTTAPAPAPASAPAPAPAPASAPAPAPAPAPPTPPSNPPFTPPPAPPFTPPVDIRDANADRVVFFSTAYTHPAGTVYFTDYDIFVLQAGYAVSDGTQISLTSTIPIEGLVFADATVKSVVARDGPVRVAALGSVTGIWGLDSGNAVLGRVGAVTEMCFDDACRSSASLGATVLLGGAALTVIGASAGVIWRATPWLGVLGELDTLEPTTLQAGKLNGLAAAAGIRLPHRVWALDLTLARPFGVSGAPTIPMAAFTIRFLP